MTCKPTPPERCRPEVERAAWFVVEALERRRLLSSSISVQNGTLQIDVNDGSNHLITVSQPQGSGQVKVTDNGIATTFAAANVTSINASAASGNDSIVLDNSTANGVTQPATLVGGSGDDTLWGGLGADSITGGSGDNDLYGGGGNNTLTGGNGGDNTLDYTSQTLPLTINDGTTNRGDGDTDQTAGFDIYRGGSGGDTITIDNLANVSIYGGAGDDNISVTVPYLSNDTTAASVLVDGGAGNDTISGDTEANNSGNINVTLNGGDGNDSIIASSFAGVNPHFDVEGGDGDDVIDYSADDYSVAPETTPDSNFDGGTGNNTINISQCDEEGETKFPLILNLNGGSNEIFGADTISNFDSGIAGSSRESSIVNANSNNDFLEGGNNDTVTGGSGNDTLVGLGAADLYGGSGSTVFVDGGLPAGSIVDGGTGFAQAQANPNVTFKHIAAFYDTPSPTDLGTDISAATTQAAHRIASALAAPSVSLSGEFAGTVGGTSYSATFHFHGPPQYTGSATRYAGIFTDGTTSTPLYAFGSLTSTSVVARNASTKKVLFSSSISASYLVMDLNGHTIKLKKQHLPTPTPTPTPTPVSPSSLASANIVKGQLVVDGTNVDEQIYITEDSSNNLSVTAASSAAQAVAIPIGALGNSVNADQLSRVASQASGEDDPLIAVFGGSGNDTLELKGSDGSDAVKVDAALYAGSGDDSLVGGAGNLRCIPGGGDDTLVGGTGPNNIADYTIQSGSLSVNLANDDATKASGAKDVLEGTFNNVYAGSGTDQLTAGSVAAGQQIFLDSGVGLDTLTGGSGAGRTFLNAAYGNTDGLDDSLYNGTGPTTFLMQDGYKETFYNYNATLDGPGSLSADATIDIDGNTGQAFGS